MPGIRQGSAQKGSQKWLQLVVNRAPHLLDQGIAQHLHFSGTDRVTWLSPLADDGYAEYRDDAFLAKLGVRADAVPLSRFWPSRGPRWDGLGRTSRGECLLVEAKAHIPELLSSATAASPRSRRQIRESLARVKTALRCRSTQDWSGTCYQYANRLAHLHFLRQLNKIPAYLVFVYFLNAEDVQGPKTAEEWAGALRLVHALLGIDEERLEKHSGNAIVDVFIDVKDVAAALGATRSPLSGS